MSTKINRVISTSNNVLERVTWDKLLEFVFKNFEIAQAKREQY